MKLVLPKGFETAALSPLPLADLETFARSGSSPRAETDCLVAMSGGVDSAVAGALAAQAGLEGVGITMRLWSAGSGSLSEKARQCCGPSAFEDARRSAATIGIPHYTVNFEAAFHEAVVEYFCAEYLAGRTPNPCVACNNLVKFGVLLEFARALDCRTLVTGHYARVFTDETGAHLLRAVDRGKDQSYMLAGLTPAQLAGMVLPLGDLSKEATRALAREFGLDIAEKRDSMDLCFVDGDYRSFILGRYPEGASAGPVITTQGREVGQHDGLLGYTVGQRRGLPETLEDGPWYVVRTDRATNAVVIGRREELARRVVHCSDVNVIRPEQFLAGACAGLAMCRYRSKAQAAVARLKGTDLMDVEFAQAVPVVSPGQLLVLYAQDGEEVVASGIIEGG